MMSDQNKIFMLKNIFVFLFGTVYPAAMGVISFLRVAIEL